VLALLLLAAIQFEGGLFRVTGWEATAEPPTGWSSVFSVYAGSGEVPPLLGTYSVEASSLVFRPRFPLSPGLRVRAVFRPPDGAIVESAFDVPATAKLPPTTRIDHVYPSSGILPANALKLYIYFSASMRRGDSWKHIHLLRDGVPVELRKQLAPDLKYDTIGESVGFFRFDNAGARRLAAIVSDYVGSDRAHLPHEEAVRDLFREGSQAVEVADVTGAPWIEIDFPNDVSRAAHEVLPQLRPIAN